MSANFDDLVWHDGTFDNMILTPSAKGSLLGELRLDVSLYPSPESAARIPLQLEFKDINALTLSCDLYELKDNRKAGNISNGYIKSANGPLLKVKIYLVDGYFELTCKKIKIKKGR